MERLGVHEASERCTLNVAHVRMWKPTVHVPFTQIASDSTGTWHPAPLSSIFLETKRTIMPAKPSRLPTARILLAEDDDSMRGFLERALERAGYDVISFANGADAFERLKEDPFALLL